MALISNTRISNLVNSQVPFFVRNDHQAFVNFLESYYEFLEQEGEQLSTLKNMRTNIDIDESVDIFIEKYYDNFLKSIPKDVRADKTLLVKHIKDFYRSRGTEKSIEFLMRIMFNEEVEEFYYPKRDVIRVSDGKWFVQKSIKVTDVKIDGVANSAISALANFRSRRIVGATSNAFAVVESADTYYESGQLVNELKITGQYREFSSGETISAVFTDSDGYDKTITANLFSGGISSVLITNAGTGYSAGTTVPIESDSGSGGVIVISSVSAGDLNSISVLEGGAGFRANNFLLFTGGGGAGANAKISTIQADNFYHPNSYNIMFSTIALEANTQLGNAIYSNLNSANINTSIISATNTFVYGPTGPISDILVINGGTNYTSNPTISVQANNRVRTLGVLGRMKIVNGGLGYQIGDPIEFVNIPGGAGTGAGANVTNVAANGMITKVDFIEVPGHIIGGSGYDQNFLPRAVVSANTGNGANVVVVACLGYGESLQSTSSEVGSILQLSIIARGSGYITPPYLNLASFGDGTAQANATIISGTYIYPGRYLNDDGHVSGYNFIQDKDYYQNYSYVIRVRRSIAAYRKALKDLIHPAGMKVFGEYLYIDDSPNVSVSTANCVVGNVSYTGTYTATGNANGTTMLIYSATRDVSNLVNVYVDVYTGNAESNIYRANIVNSSVFRVIYSANAVNSNGIVYFTSI